MKLLDFGIAKAEGKLTRTRTGLLKGKYLYMSPEQVRGDPLDGRSDVFALGAVLYEVLTGEPAFLRDTELDTLRAIVFEPVEPPRAKDPSMSAAMEAIVLKSLATNLEERFSSALQMRKALEWNAGQPGDDHTALLPLRLRRNQELSHGHSFHHGARNE